MTHTTGDDAHGAGPGPVDDPGWRPASGRPISIIRTVFLLFLGAIVGLFIVLTVIMPLSGREPDLPFEVLVLLVISLGGPAGAAWTRGQQVTCGEVGEVAVRFHTVFFIGLAAAEIPALLGFVASFLVDAYWPYLVGVAISAVGFALIAPTRDRIRRADEELARSGCVTSLREALYTARP